MGDRVAVYIDFDNVVISRYDALHGKGAWHADGARSHTMDDERLARAKVDLGAISDFATSFGVVAMTRAYADWSVPANAAYRKDLVDRAVDLVQLFAASGTKNGADIRLAVDAVEDLSRHPDITHVVLVAGDSDYVPLAQRCKRLGRTFIGIGVAGSTSSALVSACDEFAQYEQLPGLDVDARSTDASTKISTPPSNAVSKRAASGTKTGTNVQLPQQAAATALLARTMAVAKKDADGWVYAAALKSQMKRIDPAFDEKALGFSTFKNFAESRSEVVETSVRDTHQLLRLR